MGMTTVGRRVIFIKMKKTNKPHVPLPRKSASDEMVGEQAKPFVMSAVAPRPAVPRSWWQKALRPAAIAVGVLVCCGIGYFVTNSSSRPSYNRAAETESFAAASSPSTGVRRTRSTQTSSFPGGEAIRENVVLSNRAGLTDDSFRATAYVRKKVSLPKISGNCVVTGSGSGDIGECLRRQAEP